MASTEVEIWNMALGYLRAGTVSSTTENSTQARALAIYADQSRQEVLRETAPPFAIKQATLTESADANTTRYYYIYDLPSDYLKVIAALDSSYYRLEINYKVDGSHFFSDYTPGVIEYVFDQTDVTKWDADFVEMYALYLAAQAAPKVIPGGTKYQQLYYALYERKKIDLQGRWAEENKDDYYSPDKYNDWW